jgi:hypothetical protein
MNVLGLVFKLSYQLSRHRLAFLPVGYLPLFLAIAGIPASRFGLVKFDYIAILLIGGFLLASALLISKRRGYIIFRSEEGLSQEVPRLKPDEKLAIRATGQFEVEGRSCYFVEARTDFATMETREHILMARIPYSRFLLASFPKEKVGWWYIFFKPDMIREIELGRVHFGIRPRPAIRLTYEDKGERREVYLSFDDEFQRQMVLEDLLLDAQKEEVL